MQETLKSRQFLLYQTAVSPLRWKSACVFFYPWGLMCGSVAITDVKWRDKTRKGTCGVAVPVRPVTPYYVDVIRGKSINCPNPPPFYKLDPHDGSTIKHAAIQGAIAKATFIAGPQRKRQMPRYETTIARTHTHTHTHTQPYTPAGICPAITRCFGVGDGGRRWRAICDPFCAALHQAWFTGKRGGREMVEVDKQDSSATLTFYRRGCFGPSCHIN